MQPEFLELYNDELRFLHHAGEQFAHTHPQVAQHLGMHVEGVRDPFVERLLEGTAFLTARIQQRLNTEQAVFATQMLSRLAPNWLTPTPAIGTIAIEPDFTSPQCPSGAVIPRGSIVSLNDSSLPSGSVLLTTGRTIHLAPLQIEDAQCCLTPSPLPDSVAVLLQQGLSCIRLRLTTRGVMPLSSLQMACLPLAFAGDAVRANQLLSTLMTNTLRVVVWSESQRGKSNHLVLPLSSLQISGLKDDQALLPCSIGELPGMRLMREYFSSPSKFYGVEINAVQPWLRSCEDATTFEIIFVLGVRPLHLLDRISAADFRLFSTPVINLHSMRCSPVLIDPTRTEQHIVVDRLRPDRYEIHHIKEIRGVDKSGQEIMLSPLHGKAKYGDRPSPISYEIRRSRNQAGSAIYGRSALHDELFMALTMGSDPRQVDAIKTVFVDAAVCLRDAQLNQLRQPSLHLDLPLPITRIELLRSFSQARPAPNDALSWQALQIVNDNPLRHALPDVGNCATTLRTWLETFSDLFDGNDRRRIDSIRSAQISHRFERYRGKGPLAWTRGAHLLLDIQSSFHADAGAYLFSQVVQHALQDYCDLNQQFSASLQIDSDVIQALEDSHGY